MSAAKTLAKALAAAASAELLGGSSPGTPGGERLGVVGACEIDTSGNLQNFRVGVRLDERDRMEVMSLEGRNKKDTLEIVSRVPSIARSLLNILASPPT